MTTATELDDIQQKNNDSAPNTLSKEAELLEETRGKLRYLPNGRLYIPQINLIVLTGLKGSTKTCNLVRWGVRALGVWKRPVFSDFPWSYKWKDNVYEPEVLSDDAFVTYLKDIPPYSILIYDEINEAFDRQQWMTVESRIGMSAFGQIRKKLCTIIGATQFFNYLNPRLNDQTDILIHCSDMRYTNWGEFENLEPGKEALTEYYDLSGRARGKTARHPHNPRWVTGEPYYEELVFTEPYWDAFNTFRLTNIQHRFISYQMKKEKREISYGDHNADKDKTLGDLRTGLQGIFNDALANDEEWIKAGTVHRKLQVNGITTDFRTMGEVLRDMGVERTERQTEGYYYKVKQL